MGAGVGAGVKLGCGQYVGLGWGREVGGVSGGWGKDVRLGLGWWLG